MVYCNWCVWYCGHCLFSKGKKHHNIMENISVSVLWWKWGRKNQPYRPFRKHCLHHWRVSTSVFHCSTEQCLYHWRLSTSVCHCSTEQCLHHWRVSTSVTVPSKMETDSVTGTMRFLSAWEDGQCPEYQSQLLEGMSLSWMCVTLLLKRISLMKQQFVLTHRHTLLQQIDKNGRSSTGQNVSMLIFYENVRTIIFLLTRHFDRRCNCKPIAQ